ncbi:MAG TPA: cytochrome c biogenesis protein CcdA [Gaiellaceae bacterium]|nr:cytochrome c biogenesis protein CcdA [Gaiellaceae bacterium]
MIESNVLAANGIGSVPISIALAAGGLAVVNPCGFPLLPAFLSFYLGAEEKTLPRAPTRVLQGLLVGSLVTAGFVGLFTAIGLPISYGAGSIASAVPWLGLGTGAVLALAGIAAIAGARFTLPVHLTIRPRRERRATAMLLFGVAYGAASLGCTLPIFLALVGASLGADKVAVFLAYGLGMALVLMALSVGIALAREGVAHRLRPLLPHVAWLAGLLLALSGGYLVYYWARVRFGNSVTLADDPIVGLVTRYSAQLQSFAGRNGTPLLAAAGAVVGLAALSGLLRNHHLLLRRRVTEE